MSERYLAQTTPAKITLYLLCFEANLACRTGPASVWFARRQRLGPEDCRQSRQERTRQGVAPQGVQRGLQCCHAGSGGGPPSHRGGSRVMCCTRGPFCPSLMPCPKVPPQQSCVMPPALRTPSYSPHVFISHMCNRGQLARRRRALLLQERQLLRHPLHQNQGRVGLCPGTRSASPESRAMQLQ